MGVVYKAHDSSLNRSVAIKVLPHDKVADPSASSASRRKPKQPVLSTIPTLSPSMIFARIMGSTSSSWSASRVRRLNS